MGQHSGLLGSHSYTSGISIVANIKFQVKPYQIPLCPRVSYALSIGKERLSLLQDRNTKLKDRRVDVFTYQ